MAGLLVWISACGPLAFWKGTDSAQPQEKEVPVDEMKTVEINGHLALAATSHETSPSVVFSLESPVVPLDPKKITYDCQLVRMTYHLDVTEESRWFPCASPFSITEQSEMDVSFGFVGRIRVRSYLDEKLFGSTAETEIRRLPAAGGFVPRREDAAIAVTDIAQSQHGTWVAGTFHRPLSPRSFSLPNFLTLTLDGQIDPGPLAGLGNAFPPNTVIRANVVDSQGRIYLGGNITSYRGTPVARGVIRLLPDFSLDTSFNLGPSGGGFNATTRGPVFDLLVQPNADLSERLIVVGNFTSLTDNDTTHNIRGIVRLLDSGSIDTMFNPGNVAFEFNNPASDAIFAVARHPESDILAVGGKFEKYNGTTVEREDIQLLDKDGNRIDDQLDPFGVAMNTASSVVFVNDQLFVGATNRFYRLIKTGGVWQFSYEKSTTPQYSSSSTVYTSADVIRAHGENHILVGGRFAGGLRRYQQTDGELDLEFIRDLDSEDTMNPPNFGFRGTLDTPALQDDLDSIICDILVLPDLSIIVGGNFSHYSGEKTPRNIAKLHANGSLDTNFLKETNGLQNTVFSLNKITLNDQPAIFAAGTFHRMEGKTEESTSLAKFDSHGQLDATYNSQTRGFFSDSNLRTPAQISKILLEDTGAAVLGGNFLKAGNNVNRGRLARLLPNGSLDTNFFTGTGFNADVNDLEFTGNGSIVVATNSSLLNGTAISKRLTVLTPQGALDATLTGGIPTLTFGGMLINVLHKGTYTKTIYFGGNFGMANGTVHNSLGRLNSDGAFDSAFTGPPSSLLSGYPTILSIHETPTGDVYIGGLFTLSATASADFGGSTAHLFKRSITNSTWTPIMGLSHPVTSIAQPNGEQLLLGGSILSINGTSLDTEQGLAVLNIETSTLGPTLWSTSDLNISNGVEVFSGPLDSVIYFGTSKLNPLAATLQPIVRAKSATDASPVKFGFVSVFYEIFQELTQL